MSEYNSTHKFCGNANSSNSFCGNNLRIVDVRVRDGAVDFLVFTASNVEFASQQLLSWIKAKRPTLLEHVCTSFHLEQATSTETTPASTSANTVELESIPTSTSTSAESTSSEAQNQMKYSPKTTTAHLLEHLAIDFLVEDSKLKNTRQDVEQNVGQKALNKTLVEKTPNKKASSKVNTQKNKEQKPMSKVKKPAIFAGYTVRSATRNGVYKITIGQQECMMQDAEKIKNAIIRACKMIDEFYANSV